MLSIKGQAGKDLCDSNLGVTRRDLLRVGGSGMLGLSLGSMLQMQEAALLKAGRGETSLDEIARVLSPSKKKSASKTKVNAS